MRELIIEFIVRVIFLIVDIAFIVFLLVRLHKHEKAIRELQDYIAYKEQWEYEELKREKLHQSQNTTPGSAEHYEKWKAERENREP